MNFIKKACDTESWKHVLYQIEFSPLKNSAHQILWQSLSAAQIIFDTI